MSTQCEPATDAQLVDELASVFHTESAAHELLERVCFPRGRIPTFCEPAGFWRTIAQRLEAGILEGGSGLRRVVSAAAELYCGNPIFRGWLGTNRPTLEGPQGNGGATILLRTSVDAHRLFELASELARDRRLSGPLNLLCASGENVALYLSAVDALGALELSSLLAEKLNGHLRRPPIVAGDLIRDHLIDRLFVEGPDLARLDGNGKAAAAAGASPAPAGQLNERRDQMNCPGNHERNGAA
jgi:hypothetical protein